jgi:hypothetical protein
MLVEFVEDTQAWLREYHSRSIVETVNSTLKRLFVVALRKQLVERKATELLARIVVYDIRQLIYIRYTKGIDIEIRLVPKHVTLMNWIAPQGFVSQPLPEAQILDCLGPAPFDC